MIIESANVNVTMNITEGVYMAYMDENNHAFTPGSKTPILKIRNSEYL